MDDIVPGLYNAIKRTFDDEVSKNETIKVIENKIKNSKANYEDMLKYSKELGSCLEKAFIININDDVLPDSKMYYNIANRLIEPMCKDNYKTIAAHCATVQTSLNKKAKIGLKAIETTYNQDKVKGIIDYISSADKYSQREKSFLQSLSTYQKSIVDDSVQQNADFHFKSGLSPKIIRRTSGKTCKWCQKVAGIYDYADVMNTGNDVFRRHANCDCTVIYDPSNGSKKVQDVWSKKWNNQSKIDIIQKRLEKLEPKVYFGKDVTKQYISNSTPGKGKFEFEGGYKLSKHQQEIEVANLIYSVFGGNITLLNESDIEGVMKADYLWNNKFWDLKTVTTEKSADSAIRKGLKQIFKNPGGIVLDYRSKKVDIDNLLKIVDSRMKRGNNKIADIMIIINDKTFKIYRYKK